MSMYVVEGENLMYDMSIIFENLIPYEYIILEE